MNARQVLAFELSYSLSSVAVAWSVEVPAIKPGCPDSSLVGVRDFKFYPGTGYVFFVFSPMLSLAETLTFC